MNKTLTSRTVNAITSHMLLLSANDFACTEVITDKWVVKGYDYDEVRAIVVKVQRGMLQA